jgi:hypothetical protein
MKRIIVFLLGIFCICSITACAIGHKYDYSNAWPSLSYSSAKKITIAVHDQRTYVLDGRKSENYVGMFRAGFGNPWDVITENKEPLSNIMANNICGGLNNSGIKAGKVLTKYTDSKSSILNTMATTSKNSDRLIILTILEWYTDTYRNSTLLAHLMVEVYDGGKNNISKYEFKEERNLGYGEPYNTAPNAFKDIIATIFNKPEIKSSITTD